jgi:hypothetical protein
MLLLATALRGSVESVVKPANAGVTRNVKISAVKNLIGDSYPPSRQLTPTIMASFMAAISQRPQRILLVGVRSRFMQASTQPSGHLSPPYN